jgi:hypothetical protein
MVDNHPPSLPPNHKRTVDKPQNGATIFFINCHGLALLVGPLGREARRMVLLLGGVVLGVENWRHFKNFIFGNKTINLLQYNNQAAYID